MPTARTRPRRVREPVQKLQIYLTASSASEKIVLDVWREALDNERPQDLFRRILLTGIRTLVDQGEMPEVIVKNAALRQRLQEASRAEMSAAQAGRLMAEILNGAGRAHYQAAPVIFSAPPVQPAPSYEAPQIAAPEVRATGPAQEQGGVAVLERREAHPALPDPQPASPAPPEAGRRDPPPKVHEADAGGDLSADDILGLFGAPG